MVILNKNKNLKINKMKNIYSKVVLVLLSILAIGCNDDDSLSHTNVSPVNNLYAPADNTFYDLGAQSSAVFEWESAKAEDNGVVLYDVVFDREGGDFSDPVYIMPSDGKGFQPSLNISFTQLNKIAEMAGIATESIGKLKWTVYSSKGLNVQKSAVAGIFEVQRPGGFPMPDQLFITGSGSEGGENAADALPFRKTGATNYEIYTMLKAGDYKFITRKSGTPETYFIENGDLKAEGQTAYSGEDKVYRIRIDFSDGSTTMNEIAKVEFWFPVYQQFPFEYTYTGGGIWKATNKPISFQGSFVDERYKFKFTVVNGTTTSTEWFGSVNKDNSRPTDATPASFWYMVSADGSDWDYTFKFKSEIDGKNVNSEINFSASVPAYTHSFTVL